MENLEPMNSDEMIVAVIGTGLIGGSIAKGLLESGFATQVLGYDANPDRMREAIEKTFVSRKLEFEADAPSVDIWVIATPPDDVVPWLKRILPFLDAETAVTDCASVKGSILEELPEGIKHRFVGGHPMGGHQSNGLEHANAEMFVDAHWILTPFDTDDSAIKRIEQMIFALDAIPVHMAPDEHDRHVATLSHLPNVLANLLGCLGRELTFAHVAGGSWRDLTRVAGGNVELWSQIMLHNRAEIIVAIQELRSRLDAMEDALVNEDGQAVRRLFIDGQ